jgi:hypothetical protein
MEPGAVHPNGIRTRVSTLREWAGMSTEYRTVLFSQFKCAHLSIGSTEDDQAVERRWTTDGHTVHSIAGSCPFDGP